MTPEIQSFLIDWDREFATSARVIGNLPPTALEYRPHPKSMSAGELAWHLGAAERMATGWYLSGKPPAGKGPEGPKVLQDLLQAITLQHQGLVAQVREAPDAHWARPLPFHNGQTLTGGQLLKLLVLRHNIHHRGQLSVYLRLLGARVPAIYGPSADDKGG